MIVLDYIKAYSFYILGKSKSFVFGEVSSYVLPSHFIGLLLAPIIFWFYQRYKVREFKKVWTHYLLASIVLAILFGLLIRTYWMVYSYIFEPFENEVPFLEVFKRYFKFLIPSGLTGIVHFWALTILYFALDFYDQFKNKSYQSLQLEAQLKDTKLQNLRMQLNPHFLFNALNTVAMMVRRDNKSKAIHMISGISDLLRTSLNSSSEHFISLRKEIELLQKYLQIEEQRFSDRLVVEFDIDDDLLDIKIPNLLLQPLAENAFKYGVAKNINSAYIRISARKLEDKIEIEIYNKGNLLGENFKEGIGLQNTKNRLAMSYPSYHFTLTNAEDQSGVVARIEIPITYD